MFEKKIPFALQRATLGGATLLALALPLACRSTGDTPAQAPPSDAFRCEASATAAPGVYHLVPAFDTIDRVELVGATDAERVVLADREEWSFDRASHALEVHVPVGDDQRVVVWGDRTVPWRWKASQPMAQGSVRALFGDHPGESGEDFDANEAEGTIAILREELCRSGLPYFVTYQLHGDPAHPELTRSVSFGNCTDQAAIRRFLSMADESADPAESEQPEEPTMTMALAMTAAATADPSVYSLGRTLGADSLRVAIAKRAAPRELAWLEAADYAYDERAGTITLRDGLTVDGTTEYLFASGSPSRLNVISLGREIDGEVRVLLGERLLAEGVGFTVDRDAGEVTILDPEFRVKGTGFFISAGDLSLATMSLTPRMKALLEE